jgi:hypothetical protein
MKSGFSNPTYSKKTTSDDSKDIVMDEIKLSESANAFDFKKIFSPQIDEDKTKSLKSKTKKTTKKKGI